MIHVVFAILLIILASWRLFGKRQRLPPGPRGRPLLGHLGLIPKVQPWLWFTGLARNYGEIYTLRILGRPVIVLNSFKSIEEVFIRRSNKYSNKPRRVMGELSGLTGSMSFMNPGALLRNARKQFTLELNARGIQRYHTTMEDASRMLIQDLAADLGCSKLEDHVNRAVGVVSTRISFGHSIYDPADPVMRQARELADYASHVLGGAYAILDFFPFLPSLPDWAPGTGLVRLAKSWKAQLISLADTTAGVVQRDLMAGSAPTSFMSNVYSRMHHNLEPEEEQNAKMIAVTMFAGGMLPLQSAILTFLHAMARNPESQKRAQEELDSVLGGTRLPTVADRAALPYMTAILAETLRWVPVGPLISRKALEDDEWNGYFIPKGTTLVANNWAVSRDPVMYPDPEQWRPERYLDKSEDIVNPWDYAFGYGRRKCPGLPMTDTLCFMIFATVLAVFDIKPAGRSIKQELQTKGAALCRIESAECIVRVRSPQLVGVCKETNEMDLAQPAASEPEVRP
ncbi:cytochrome P450 [Obba rivulosa]|uniref:Cytochrome P450 n=1 Tax=Obba rivulosa TaxID=1052685 RepID=A0A8E2DJB0_9APHY|nr:cytochrome P450 [Obba rivulosa]